MATTPSIVLNNITSSYFPATFDPLNLTFSQQKYGLVGKNGIGKTTLLKLILGKTIANSGSIQCLGSIDYVPQLHTAYEHATIADALNVTAILQALNNIQNGSCDERDFAVIDNHWDIEARLSAIFNHFHLRDIDLNQPFNQLSGGQKTKVLLAKTLIFPADFILFDEPTNNLDKEARQILYDYIEGSNKGVIIASHDRTLLNHCDCIIELNTLGVDCYGGNYDAFKMQKKTKQQAIENEIQARAEILQKSKQLVQTRMERHQQNEARGRRGKLAQIKAKGSYDKISFKSQKGKSEKTNRRIRLQSQRKLESVNSQLTEAKSKREHDKTLNISLEKTHVPSNKIILEIDHLYFSHLPNTRLIDDFNLKMTGASRIAICGKNGSGKSTLIQLILGHLTPQQGHISIGTTNVTYLDQSVRFLDPALSIIDNFLLLNANAKIYDAYAALASFKFRNKDAEKKVSELSGGEKMRAGLAVALMSDNPPQLIILDEPTNHLDMETTEAIEQALQQYQGALLAVSHDDVFLKHIHIDRFILINPVSLGISHPNIDF